MIPSQWCPPFEPLLLELLSPALLGPAVVGRRRRRATWRVRARGSCRSAGGDGSGGRLAKCMAAPSVLDLASTRLLLETTRALGARLLVGGKASAARPRRLSSGGWRSGGTGR